VQVSVGLCRAISVVLLAAGVAGCGSGNAGPKALKVSDLSMANVNEKAAFWDAQTAAGKVQMATICKARAAQAARHDAEVSTPDDPADPAASITAGYEAVAAVSGLDSSQLAAAITKAFRADQAGNATIASVCEDLVQAMTQPTTIQLDNLKPVVGLGEKDTTGYAVTSKPLKTLTVTGTVDPVREGAEIQLERRTADSWEYLRSITPASDGTFKARLPAYRKNSNLYRLKASGGRGAKPAAAAVYFDGAGF